MRILLHICCAPCSTAVFERLNSSGNEVVGFFYNPNIQDENEYGLRLEEEMEYARKTGIEIIEGEYDTKNWNEHAGKYPHEPEGGRRCAICFRIRLRKTGETADELGFELFTTTLSVSPYKNADLLNAIGEEISENLKANYLESNFKKMDGYKRSLELCREHELYRQDYCGCNYSKLEKERTRKNKGTLGKLRYQDQIDKQDGI